MGDKIYIGKKTTGENPINNKNYQELLGLNPALTKEIQRNVNYVLFENIKEIEMADLDDNSNIISEKEIQKAKSELITELEELEELTGESEHIIVVADDCFTNTKLLLLLKNILGKENYRKYVKVVDIDYNNPANEDHLEENLSINNSLFILGGSLSDTYDMHDSHYHSILAETIKQVGDEYAPRFLNKRILGICFGQQYLANITGIANKNSSGIIATLKGPTQLAPSNCHVEKLEYINPIFSDVLKGLTNTSSNFTFSSIFTRSGYVSFDLLKSEGNLGIVPLIKDEATSGIVGWGSKNGNIFGVQFHPELNFLSQKVNTRKYIKNIISHISKDEEEKMKFLKNFTKEIDIKRDIGEAFYVFTILAYIRDINKSYNKISSTFDDENEVLEVSHSEASKRLTKTISERVDFALLENEHLEILEMKKKWIDAIDKKGRLLLNYMLDWKVNRSIEEISEMLGIRSIVDMIEEHKTMQNSGNYIIRDLGAGDGNTIKELYNNLKSKDVIIYGTGDYIYFDLFSALNKTNFKETMNEELLILFVEKVVGEFRKLKSDSTIWKIRTAVENIEFNVDDKISNSSMTNKKTLMFESESESNLSSEIIENFPKHKIELEELKKFVLENIYTMFGGFFQRIYISKFNDLHIEDEIISKLDFQYTIRSTSHVNGREYMKIISEYFYNSAKTGSIFIDNGIHQSYTSIPRLKELYDVSLDIVGGNFKLLYNKENNYFSSVIITKDADFGDEFIEKHLDKNHIIVSLREAYRSTFFKLEYFIRNFIISNFKNSNVFWDSKKRIIDTLIVIMKELEKNNKVNIPYIILELINHIAKNYKNRGVTYNEIDISILNSYIIDGEKLSDILKRDVFIPNWMNIYANRDY